LQGVEEGGTFWGRDRPVVAGLVEIFPAGTETDM
jgi:hypothetical protein